MSAETPQAFIREAIRLLALSRHGQTATGHAARIIPCDELDQVVLNLAQAIGELDVQVVVDDPRPFVAWGTKNFGEWHRQGAEHVTRCGVLVPFLRARVCYRAGSAPRPTDYCKRCWAPEPAGVGSLT